MKFCPDCDDDDLIELDDYIECGNCGERFWVGSTDDDFEHYEEDEGLFYD